MNARVVCAGRRDSAIEGLAFDVARRGDQCPSDAAAEGGRVSGEEARFGEPVRDAILEDENLRRREQWRFSGDQLHLPRVGSSRLTPAGARGAEGEGSGRRLPHPGAVQSEAPIHE